MQSTINIDIGSRPPDRWSEVVHSVALVRGDVDVLRCESTPRGVVVVASTVGLDDAAVRRRFDEFATQAKAALLEEKSGEASRPEPGNTFNFNDSTFNNSAVGPEAQVHNHASPVTKPAPSRVSSILDSATSQAIGGVVAAVLAAAILGGLSYVFAGGPEAAKAPTPTSVPVPVPVSQPQPQLGGGQPPTPVHEPMPRRGVTVEEMFDAAEKQQADQVDTLVKDDCVNSIFVRDDTATHRVFRTSELIAVRLHPVDNLEMKFPFLRDLGKTPTALTVKTEAGAFDVPCDPGLSQTSFCALHYNLHGTVDHGDAAGANGYRSDFETLLTAMQATPVVATVFTFRDGGTAEYSVPANSARKLQAALQCLW